MQKGKKILAEADWAWSEIQDTPIENFGAKVYANLMRELNRLADCADSGGP